MFIFVLKRITENEVKLLKKLCKSQEIVKFRTVIRFCIKSSPIKLHFCFFFEPGT